MERHPTKQKQKRNLGCLSGHPANDGGRGARVSHIGSLNRVSLHLFHAFGILAEKKQKINLNDCDLTEEQLEELRVICKFKDWEIKYLRVRFLSVLEDGEQDFEPSFLFRFPEIQRNPLRNQLLKIFDLDRSGRWFRFTRHICIT